MQTNLFSLIFFIKTVASATIAELMRANPQLSQVVSQESKYPMWSAPGQITVFAPTNDAIAAASLPSGNVGVVTSNQYLPISTTYSLVQDTMGTYQSVFNNGNTGSATSLSVEIRSALNSGQATAYQVADNGVLYTVNVAIAPPPSVSKALVNLRCIQFSKMIAQTGLTTFLDQLKNVTIFAPNDDAYQAIYAPVLSTLSTGQLRAYVLYQIIPQLIYSSNFPSGNYPSLLAENSINIKSSTSGVMLPGATSEIFDQADNFVEGGIIHRIAFFMTPQSLPSATQAVVPANVPAGSGAFNPNSPTVTVSSLSSSPTMNSDLRVGRDKVMSGIAAAAGIMAMMV